MKLKRKVSILRVSVCACVYACALQPHVLPARLLWPWDFPGKNTGVAYHFLLQGVFRPGIKPLSPALRMDSLPLNHLGKSQDLVQPNKELIV